MAKILVADDNSNIQKMVGLALKDQGIDVVAVGNGEAAVRKISDLKPDLVLADVFMPVRNGYEVCKYVKDDPALQHIPVILLVGAFDPLDEQEAQRVGADGVLKKPFVPPDPLISMVKSALARAGVALGNAPVVEKSPEPTKRTAADLLTPAASKLAALREATKLPEPEPEPFVEQFATLPEQVKIPAGDQPLAFGSLLETEEAEDDAAFIPSKPPTELGSGTGEWSEDPAEDEETEEKEESDGNGWRPGGSLDAPSLAAIDDKEMDNHVPDWREAAFHGSSPSKLNKSHAWAPAIDEPVHAEAASSVGVTTLEAVKPTEMEVPAFSGDAWAAAMSAGVEEKAQDVPEAPTELAPAVEEKIEEAHAEEFRAETAVVPPTTGDNEWYSVSASPWEVEAKRATMLASTWDSAVSETPAPESGAAEKVSASETVNAIPSQLHEEIREVAHEIVVESAHAMEDTVPSQANVEETAKSEECTSTLVTEAAGGQEQAEAPSEYSANTVEETRGTETLPDIDSKSWESTWVAAPVDVASQSIEAPRQAFPESNANEKLETGSDSELPGGTQEESVRATETVAQEVAHVLPVEAAAERKNTPETEPNMDELVARVLARMNPDMLHKMTQELLKPVIAAIVQDEINSRKQ